MLEMYFIINWINQQFCNGILISIIGSSLDFFKEVTNVVYAFEVDLEGYRFSCRLFFNMVSLLLCIQKLRGTFQHSRFLAGGATSAAGKLTV